MHWNCIPVEASESRRDGGRGGVGRGGRGSRGRGGQGHSSTRPEGRRFRETKATIMSVETFVTPQKDSKNKNSANLQAAENFLSHPAVINLYEGIRPIRGSHAQRQGQEAGLSTRRSELYKFGDRGVDPMWKANEMSDGRAFYTTNSIQQAVAHVLYVHPS